MSQIGSYPEGISTFFHDFPPQCTAFPFDLSRSSTRKDLTIHRAPPERMSQKVRLRPAGQQGDISREGKPIPPLLTLSPKFQFRTTFDSFDHSIYINLYSTSRNSMGLRNLFTTDGTSRARTRRSKAPKLSTQGGTRRSGFFGKRSKAHGSRRHASVTQSMDSDMTLFSDPASAPGAHQTDIPGIRAGTGAGTGAKYTQFANPTGGVSRVISAYTKGPNYNFADHRRAVQTQMILDAMAPQSTQAEHRVHHQPVPIAPFDESQVRQIMTAIANTYVEAMSRCQQPVFSPFNDRSFASPSALPEGATVMLVILPKASFVNPSLYTTGPAHGGDYRPPVLTTGQASFAAHRAERNFYNPDHSVNMGSRFETIHGSNAGSVQSPGPAYQGGFAPSQAPSYQPIQPNFAAAQSLAGPSFRGNLASANEGATQGGVARWLDQTPLPPPQNQSTCAREAQEHYGPQGTMGGSVY